MNTLSKTTSRGPANMLRLICLIGAIAMWLVAVIVYGASVPRMLLLLGFYIFYIQLPGLLITNHLGFRPAHISTGLITGIFAGWGFNVLVYFISDIIPTDILLCIAAPVLSFIYLYELYKKKQKPLIIGRFRPSKLSLPLCLFMLLVLLYCMSSVQYHYLAPDLADFTIMNSDKAYHLGLINSLSHDYPMESPWVSGRFITYHIFSEILMAIPVRLYDVPCDVVMLSAGPFWTAYTFCLAVYSFFREMSGKPERAGLYSLLLLLSNIYVTRDAITSLAYKFVLENDNASGYGVAAVLVTVIVFKKWYEAFGKKAPTRYGLLALLVFFMMLTTGIKGPMGAVLAASMFGTLLLGVILRKVSPIVLLPLTAVFAGFALIYMTVLSGRGVSNASGDSIFAFATVADIAFWKKPLVAAMQSMGIPTVIRLAVVLIVFIAFMLTVFFLPFCIGYIRELILVLSGKKAFEPAKVLIYAACLVGFILLMIMNYSGHSQVYFGLVTVFLAPIVALWFIEDMEEKAGSSARAGRVLKVCAAVMGITLIFTAAGFSIYLGGNLADAIKAANPHRSPDKYMSISNEEYDAMCWIRENTEEDALLATDRYYSVSPKKYHVDNRWDNRFFLYAVYSNRFTYISGSGYNIPDRDYEIRREMIHENAELYDPNNEERGEKARELGVDYVVVSKRFSPVGDLSSKDYEKCYSNDEVDVYKIAG